MQQIASSEEIRNNEIFATKVNETKLLLTRFDGEVYAVIDKCTHLNLSMRNGKINGKVITCPFHGSCFDMTNGENLDWVNGVLGVNVPKWTSKLLEFGKKPAPLESLTVEEKDGKVFVALGS